MNKQFKPLSPQTNKRTSQTY